MRHNPSVETDSLAVEVLTQEAYILLMYACYFQL